MSLYGVVETGGTKMVCAIVAGPDDIRAEVRFPTTTPEEIRPSTMEVPSVPALKFTKPSCITVVPEAR